jgi:hypothetical protein
MRKIKEVLRLYHEVHLGQREIARCAQPAQSTVHEYLERARAAGLGWPLPEGQDEEAIENLLFPHPASAEKPYPIPDYRHIDEELRTHSHLTLQLLWEEYRRAHVDGCCYSRFCVLLSANISSDRDRCWNLARLTFFSEIVVREKAAVP